MELAGRCAAVTGAGTGIGEAVAQRLAAEGAAVAVIDVDAETGRGTASDIRHAGGHAVFVPADVGEPQSVAVMLDVVQRSLGPLDVLVNNAGVVSDPEFPECEPEAWMRVLDVNLRGTMLATQFAIRALRGRGGAIVNVASLAGIGYGTHPAPDYAATKAGIVRFTAALGDLAGEGIRVNCVCPDWVDTPMSRRTLARMSPAELRVAVPPVLTQPDEIADAVAGLVHDDSLAGRVLCCYTGGHRHLVPVDTWV